MSCLLERLTRKYLPMTLGYGRVGVVSEWAWFGWAKNTCIMLSCLLQTGKMSRSFTEHEKSVTCLEVNIKKCTVVWEGIHVYVL